MNSIIQLFYTLLFILFGTLNSLMAFENLADTVSFPPKWTEAFPAELASQQKAQRKFYLDSKRGNDKARGTSPQSAWKTLARLNRHQFQAGDHIHLKTGSCFKGSLILKNIVGQAEAFIQIKAYGSKDQDLPLINAKGYEAGIKIVDSQFIQISHLEIINDNGQKKPVTSSILAKINDKQNKGWFNKNPAKDFEVMGVDITSSEGSTTQNIYLSRVYIHSIFPKKNMPSEGRISRTFHGYGIRILKPKKTNSALKNIVIEKSKIENTGFYGILVRARQNDEKVKNIVIRKNRTDRTGGSALLAAWLTNCYVQGNIFNRSGDFDDARKHGRGSGSWTFSADNVLYENNMLMNSKGKGDSAGVHVDFNCQNVIVQRNISYNNEGGFMEVLGNNYNCAYRYNISINDGARIKKKNGATQEGKVLFVSGHCMQAPFGPFNSYFYNNTIYVKKGLNPKFAITHSAKGLMIVNNIFHLMDDGKGVRGDQPTAKRWRRKAGQSAKNVIFENNIYTRETTLPNDLVVNDRKKIIANPLYRQEGSLNPKAYIPNNISAVKDKGLVMKNLPGDHIGLEGGVQVKVDFFGRAIEDQPDIGAIEVK